MGEPTKIDNLLPDDREALEKMFEVKPLPLCPLAGPSGRRWRALYFDLRFEHRLLL